MSSQICSEIKWPLLQDMIRNNQANQIMCLTLVDKIELFKYTIFRIITDFYMKQPSNSISAWWLAKNYDLKNFLIDSCFTIKLFKFDWCTWFQRWISNFWTKFWFLYQIPEDDSPFTLIGNYYNIILNKNICFRKIASSPKKGNVQLHEKMMMWILHN